MDLVTFGEALIRLTPNGVALQDAAPPLAAHVGGAELNVAVAAARLGLATRWVSRLPDHALARFIEATARQHGVEPRIEWTPDGRVGTYFLGEGGSPRQPSVVYDRAGSAFSEIGPRSTNWAPLFRDASWFHTSGITPALSESAALVTAEALQAARKAGLTVSYDVNYRPKLWNPDRARVVQTPLLEHVHLLIVSEEDARTVFCVRGTTTDEIARALATELDCVVVITVRDSRDGVGAVVVADGTIHIAPRYAVNVVERVGTGDAFSAGLIASRLQNRTWDESARYACATAACKLTMSGDFFVGTQADVKALLERNHTGVAR